MLRTGLRYLSHKFTIHPLLRAQVYFFFVAELKKLVLIAGSRKQELVTISIFADLADLHVILSELWRLKV
jgi:hypothetical protein